MKKQAINHSGERDIYRTGSTNPPKSYQGILATLLILVIFLGGVVSVLGLMNVRLFQILEQQDTDPVEFSQHTTPEVSPQMDAMPEGFFSEKLGVTVLEMNNLYRTYQDWPEGVYISEIRPNSPAHRADLRPGDILLTVGGVAIDSQADLEEVSSQVGGEDLTLTVFRQEKEVTVSLTLEEE